jgi:hypothetical protein
VILNCAGTNVPLFKARGVVVVAAAPGGGAGVEADDEDELEGKLDYEYEFYDADDDLAEQGQPRRGTLATAWVLAGIAAAAEHGRHLTEPATRLTAARRLVHVGGREVDCTQRQISLQQKLASIYILHIGFFSLYSKVF